MGILLSRHCPVWAGGGSMRPLQRLAYVNCVAYPLTSIPLTVYCALSAVCLLTGKFIIPPVPVHHFFQPSWSSCVGKQVSGR